MANLLKRHEFWLGMFIIALCLLLVALLALGVAR